MKAQEFCKEWTAMLWRAMGATGKGYKRDSLRHTGKGDDRRNDKVTERDDEGNITRRPEPKLLRWYRARYS